MNRPLKSKHAEKREHHFAVTTRATERQDDPAFVLYEGITQGDVLGYFYDQTVAADIAELLNQKHKEKP